MEQVLMEVLQKPRRKPSSGEYKYSDDVPSITKKEALAAMSKFGNLQFLRGSEHKKAAFNKIYLALGEFFLEAAKIGKKGRARVRTGDPVKDKGKVDIKYVRREYNKALQRAFKKIVLSN